MHNPPWCPSRSSMTLGMMHDNWCSYPGLRDAPSTPMLMEFQTEQSLTSGCGRMPRVPCWHLVCPACDPSVCVCGSFNPCRVFYWLWFFYHFPTARSMLFRAQGSGVIQAPCRCHQVWATPAARQQCVESAHQHLQVTRGGMWHGNIWEWKPQYM